ncbi:hypothetical protein FRC10_011380 [Ceratobasidium sp. 414]|nr:hypothetical protein FRC10_011380 [Ceratobasidium sp. 414]
MLHQALMGRTINLHGLINGQHWKTFIAFPLVVSADMPMDVHPSAFRRWKSARTMLTCAINDYLAASAGLCDALSSPACHPPSRYSLEQMLSEIDLELSSLQLEEEKLKHTRATLANERNRSGTLAPVHKLPSEILAAIFTLSSGRYTRCDRTANLRAVHVSPTVLAEVCSSWRQLALRSPSLWSYVDVIVANKRGPHHNTQATHWVERSQNVPLYVSVRDCNPLYNNSRYTITQYHVEKLIKFLAPLMHRVHALDMSAPLDLNVMLSSVMECWIKNGSSDIEKTLQVSNTFRNYSREQSYFFLEPAYNASAKIAEFNTFFGTITRLFVRNCGISKLIAFHEGLVELHLAELVPYRGPTQQQLVAMLAACPRLRILALANCWIGPSDETPSPVTLNYLQSLSLEMDDTGYGFAHVFPLLLIGSDALSMSLTLEDNPEFIAELKVLFSRTKVTTLCVRERHRQSLTALLCPIPYLETLAIDHFDIYGQAFQHCFGANSDGRNEVLWPRLHTLYLRNVSIDASCLQKLVLLHPSIKKLHIYRPFPAGTHAKFMTDEECDHLGELMDMVEDYHIDFGSGNGPIDTWDFVILEE